MTMLSFAGEAAAAGDTLRLPFCTAAVDARPWALTPITHTRELHCLFLLQESCIDLTDWHSSRAVQTHTPRQNGSGSLVGHATHMLALYVVTCNISLVASLLLLFELSTGGMQSGFGRPLVTCSR